MGPPAPASRALVTALAVAGTAQAAAYVSVSAGGSHNCAVTVFKRKVFRRRRHAADVDLRGLPKGKFTVRIVVVATDGQQLQGTRTYRTCAKRRGPGRPGPL